MQGHITGKNNQVVGLGRWSTQMLGAGGRRGQKSSNESAGGGVGQKSSHESAGGGGRSMFGFNFAAILIAFSYDSILKDFFAFSINSLPFLQIFLLN